MVSFLIAAAGALGNGVVSYLFLAHPVGRVVVSHRIGIGLLIAAILCAGGAGATLPAALESLR